MSFSFVILAEAGIQSYHILMDSRLRGNDRIWTFYRCIINNGLAKDQGGSTDNILGSLMPQV